MKENKYDNDIFFEKYSQMERSKKGLSGAGEWETLKALLPDFQGQRLLDLGCGYGWHCIYAMEHGAVSAVGVDISGKMLEVAREKTEDSRVRYVECAMEDIDFPDESFDVVLSSLAFHYVESFSQVVDKVSIEKVLEAVGVTKIVTVAPLDLELAVNTVKDSLAPGGYFVFSVEHPVFTAYGSQDWYYDENGNILHFPVDNYYYEGKRKAVFLGEEVVKYHRTLTTYLNTLLTHGFELSQVVEPQPPESMLHIPGMLDEMRRPMMLIVSARKRS